MRDHDQPRDHDYLYTAVQEHSQDHTQMPKASWDNTDMIQLLLPGGKLEHTFHFPADLTPFPVRADFSAAWPILGDFCLRQPHSLPIQVFTLCDPCQGTKQPGLLPRSGPVLCQG